MQKHVNLVDLVKSFPTNIFLQNLASIQKRTSPIKFAHLAEESENGSISNLSTKVQARDIGQTVALYDEHVGRLLGTVDDASSPRRDSRELIRDYFDHFIGNHEKLVAHFPKFDAKDVQFIDDKTAVYSGYYTFELTPFGGETKLANAKFTFIIHRTLLDGVQFVLHNSGITPAGVVLKSEA